MPMILRWEPVLGVLRQLLAAEEQDARALARGPWLRQTSSPSSGRPARGWADAAMLAGRAPMIEA